MVPFSEAGELGVHSIVLTGGEPSLRGDTTDLIARHRPLLFFVITNGLLMTSVIARRIALSANAISLVSIEGSFADTDERRRPGAHETAMRTFDQLRKAKALFGFVATNTAANTVQLATEAFVNQKLSDYVNCSLS